VVALADLAPIQAVAEPTQVFMAAQALVAAVAVRRTSRSRMGLQPRSSLPLVVAAAVVPVCPTEVRVRQLKARLLRAPLVAMARSLLATVVVAVQVAVAIRRAEPAVHLELPTMVVVAVASRGRTRLAELQVWLAATAGQLLALMAQFRSPIP